MKNTLHLHFTDVYGTIHGLLGKPVKKKRSTTSIYLQYLKGVFAKNEKGYRLNAIKKRF